MPQATDKASPRQRSARKKIESQGDTNDSKSNNGAQNSHRGWEMSAYDALQVNYVDHEVETKLKQ